MLGPAFFDRDAQALARALLGKVLRRRHGDLWLAAMVVETEAYYLEDRGSHSSLGRTPSREPMFMAPGTIYMYHSRGGDSMNLGAAGEGNAVLLKAGRPWVDALSGDDSLQLMTRLNPRRDGTPRPRERLCAGQTLLCRALDLKIREWTGRTLSRDALYLDDVGYTPERVVQARRLGIPAGRDEHLPYRFIDFAHLDSATKNPLRRRALVEGRDYWLHGD